MTSYLSEEQFELKFEAAMMNTYDKFFAASPVKTGFLRSMIKPIKTSNGFVIEISEVPYAI